MEGLNNSKIEKLFQMEDLESLAERDHREKEEKFYRDRKKMIFNKLGEKRHLQIQSKQNTIQMYFAPEVPEDMQMDIQKEEDFYEVPGKKTYARVDQHFKKKEIRRAGKNAGIVILHGTSNRIVPKYAAFTVDSWDM